MAYRVHSSAKPINLNQLWCMPTNFSQNPFLTQSNAKSDNGSESDQCEPTHINPIGEIIIKPTKYQLMLDMLHFELHEVFIRAVHNGFYVKAEHKEIVNNKEYVTHHFYREYVLPHDIDPNGARSWMTTEHILYIEAPKVKFDPALSDEEGDIIDVEIMKCQ